MEPISSRAFARGLRRLDAEEFAAFVADLYRARGREARVEDGAVVIEDEDRERRLAVRHAGRLGLARGAAPADAAATVTTARRPESGIGPEALREMVLYAIDPADADALLREYLGRPARVEREPRELPRIDPGRAVAVVGAVLLLAVAVGYAGVALPGGTAGPATPTPADASVTTATPGTVSPDAFAFYPPGVGEDGVTDTDALARAHLRFISGRSYELLVKHIEYLDDNSRMVRVQAVDVEAPGVYVSETWRHPDFRRATPLLDDSPAYANGSHRFTLHREFAGTRYQIEPVDDDEGRFERRAWIFLNRFLPVRNASVRERELSDGSTVFEVYGQARRISQAAPPESIAVVEPSGFVRRFTWVYPPTDARRTTIEVTMEYSGVGETTVEPPDWYAGVRNGSLNQSYGNILERRATP